MVPRTGLDFDLVRTEQRRGKRGCGQEQRVDAREGRVETGADQTAHSATVEIVAGAHRPPQQEPVTDARREGLRRRLERGAVDVRGFRPYHLQVSLVGQLHVGRCDVHEHQPGVAARRASSSS